MPRKVRDYRAEYARRVERARILGLSRSQARGHPRRNEVGLAELRQMRHAATKIKSPGRGGPKRSAKRHAAQLRVAELAGVTRPAAMSSTDATRRLSSTDLFVEKFIELGLGSRQEAYTLWFSP